MRHVDRVCEREVPGSGPGRRRILGGSGHARHGAPEAVGGRPGAATAVRRRWSRTQVATGTTTSKPRTGSGGTAGGGRRAGTPTAPATGRPTRRLVIVESGTKAKKIQQYL